jgi:hypothetical protein
MDIVSLNSGEDSRWTQKASGRNDCIRFWGLECFDLLRVSCRILKIKISGNSKKSRQGEIALQHRPVRRLTLTDCKDRVMDYSPYLTLADCKDRV